MGGGVKEPHRPSALATARAWFVTLPGRLYRADGGGRVDDEDAFSGQDGAVAWYPGLGRQLPRVPSGFQRLAGPGLAVRGSVAVRGRLVRFVPTPFWSRRGFHDWERESTSDVGAAGGWTRLEFTDGSAAVLRR